MKIYKFKDLREKEKLSHFFQIIEKNSIWCASPNSLNDRKEFEFEINYRPTQVTACLLAQVSERYGHSLPEHVIKQGMPDNMIEGIVKPEIDDIIQNCKNTIGVTSFSIEENIDVLWHRYGGEGNGAAVELEIPDSIIGEIFHIVNYTQKKIFHVDVFLDSLLGSPKEIYRLILCTKTRDDWANEKEIRFIGKHLDVNCTFEYPVTKVRIGKKVEKTVLDRAINCCHSKNIKYDFQE